MRHAGGDGNTSATTKRYTHVTSLIKRCFDDRAFTVETSMGTSLQMLGGCMATYFKYRVQRLGFTWHMQYWNANAMQYNVMQCNAEQ